MAFKAKVLKFEILFDFKHINFFLLKTALTQNVYKLYKKLGLFYLNLI